MKTRRLLVLSFLLLAFGLSLFFGNCNGSTGFSAGIPVSAASIKIDITTTGIPAIIGFVSTLLGALLLTIAAIAALVSEFQRAARPAKDQNQPLRPWH